jgi:hypothetical protein
MWLPVRRSRIAAAVFALLVWLSWRRRRRQLAAVLTSPKGGLKQLLTKQLLDPDSCKDEGLANFVHGMRIIFDEVPVLVQHLFRKRWNGVYPDNAWDDTPASGRLMWNGSDLNVAVEGAWSCAGKGLMVQVPSAGNASAHIELLSYVPRAQRL